jgi:hypothetical protein
MPLAKEKYLKELKRRGTESHVYRKYQLIGLEISQILNDEKHKALYIKLAKEMNADQLMGIAKDIAERTNVKNKGAYFMSVLAGIKKDSAVKVPLKSFIKQFPQ